MTNCDRCADSAHLGQCNPLMVQLAAERQRADELQYGNDRITRQFIKACDRAERLEAALREWQEHHALWECDCKGEHVPARSVSAKGCKWCDCGNPGCDGDPVCDHCHGRENARSASANEPSGPACGTRYEQSVPYWCDRNKDHEGPHSWNPWERKEG